MSEATSGAVVGAVPDIATLIRATKYAASPSYKSPNSGGSNQLVSDRPPSITIAAPVT
jgi:hypothetical protein